jgi:1,4-alpha-glucan branching enzyme
MKQAEGKRGRKISFQLTAEPGNEVFVAGTFNSWDPKRHQMRDGQNTGIYKTTLVLPRGRHEYKFVVNGDWCTDPGRPDRVMNDQGSLNSVITV